MLHMQYEVQLASPLKAELLSGSIFSWNFTMPKRKCKFTSELKTKYPCFGRGREEWEALCLVCRAGTYVSVANKGVIDL